MVRQGTVTLALARADDTMTTQWPLEIIERYDQLVRLKISGQLILNFNGGQIQSFEVKEHHRL